MSSSAHPISGRRFLATVAAVSTASWAAGCSGASNNTPQSSSSGWSLPSTDPTATISVLSHLSLKESGMQKV